MDFVPKIPCCCGEFWFSGESIAEIDDFVEIGCIEPIFQGKPRSFPNF